jgi:UDP-N-acetylmuramate: L-alanyl-gamma-D-glutamyl-meso-diaminopimelate ligase
VGVDARTLLPALAGFRGPRRRLELLADAGGVRVYDDFAHHPTAIRTTLEGLRAFRRTAGRGGGAAQQFDAPGRARRRAGAGAGPGERVFFLARPDLPWDAGAVLAALRGAGSAHPDVDALLAALAAEARPGDVVVFMSNGGFEAAPRRFAERIAETR